MTEKIQINLRVDENLLKQIDEKAQQENRTRNNFIENLIKEYLKQKEQ